MKKSKESLRSLWNTIKLTIYALWDSQKKRMKGAKSLLDELLAENVSQIKWTYKFKNLMELQLGQIQRTTLGPIIKKGGEGGSGILYLKWRKKKQQLSTKKTLFNKVVLQKWRIKTFPNKQKIKSSLSLDLLYKKCWRKSFKLWKDGR